MVAVPECAFSYSEISCLVIMSNILIDLSLDPVITRLALSQIATACILSIILNEAFMTTIHSTRMRFVEDM